ncbi:hypothetical protein [Arthrobacter sp. NPDC056493]|uniref:hypothetical protein n=1 Tax=Arthrobacter sp. NPDC056493 TaxID=3345839 RepID=UPI00366F755F
MTNSDSGQEERRLDDERCVEALLTEAGLPDDDEMRALLLEMRNLRVADVPEPSAEVAALMGQRETADVIRLEDRPRKHPGKGRVMFTSLAVAASLGIAGGAAAGNDTLRGQAEGTISSIISLFQPTPAKPAPTSPAPTSPVPASPAPAPKPAQAPWPAPAVVLPLPESAPAAPVSVPAPRAESSGGDRREDSPKPRHGRHGREDAGPGRSAAVTQPGGTPAETGSSRRADVPRHPTERGAFDGRGHDRPAFERRGYDRLAGGTEAPRHANPKGKARHNGGAGQDAGRGAWHPGTAAAHRGDRR